MSTPPSGSPTKTVELGKIPVARLLFVLLHQRFTGTMQLEQPAPSSGTRTVWFEGGMPLYTDWVAPDLVLGQVMLAGQLITEDQLYAALEAMADSGGLLGQILLRQGAIDANTLSDGLRRQCLYKLMELFALYSGTVCVTSMRHEQAQQFAKVNVLELVLQGVGRHYDLERIASEMGSALHGALEATSAFSRYRGHFRFRDMDAPALDTLARGPATLDALSHLRGVTLKRAAQLAYTLWACQMLRSSTQDKPAAKAASASRSTGRQVALGAATAGKHASVSSSSQPHLAASSTTGEHASVSSSRGSLTTGKYSTVSASRSSASATRSSAPAPQTPRSTFVTELEQIEAKIADEAHAFDLLGVPVTADKRDIRRAFADLSRHFHPDALQGRGLAHLRERVSSAFAALSEAQMVLVDKDKREELRKSIEGGQGGRPQSSADATATARAALESELIAKEADRWLRAGRFSQALDRFQDAAALNPAEDDLQAAIVWCRYNLSDQEKKAGKLAERALSEILDANPNLARAHYFRGLVLKDQGRMQHAVAAFNAAYSADPRLLDAERQARALRRAAGESGEHKTRRRGKPESTGRFGIRGLFGKK